MIRAAAGRLRARHGARPGAIEAHGQGGRLEDRLAASQGPLPPPPRPVDGDEAAVRPGLARPGLALEPRAPVLYFLQRLRDEAHRFAIGTHRTRRSMGISRSGLDEVPGIGASRKRALLHHFGSARAVATATLEDLQAVPGVSRTMAKKIYDHFRSGG